MLLTRRRRLDVELVRRGLVFSREQAQLAISEGAVLVGGSQADKAARLVDPDEPLVLLDRSDSFASRGGQKLEAALEFFGIKCEGSRVVDAGASTGGFTDCVLRRGAKHVFAVDVGHGQLHERLRVDPRVSVLDRLNVRYLTLDHVEGRPVDMVVADLSFISLKTVAAVLLGDLISQHGCVVTLVKPQFESNKAEVSRGKGIIRDPIIWSRILEEFVSSVQNYGAELVGMTVSPVRGAKGNVEFLAHLRPHVTTRVEGIPRQIIRQVVNEAMELSS